MLVRPVVGRLLLLVWVASAGCSNGAESGAESMTGTTLPLAETALDDPEVTTVASALAPSQITASTAPRPDTPPPCEADDVELWTAAVRPAVTTADAVVRMRNVSDTWCEADIGRSPRLDPAIEPDVWLQPGDTADLVVGQAVDPCDEPTLATAVQVGIGDASVVVPSALLTCEWWLNAFYPNDAVTNPCGRGDLDVVATTGAVVIGSTSTTPCLIDPLTAVDGVPLAASASGPAIEIFPDDVVAVGRPGDAECDGPTGRTLRFGAGLDIAVDGVPCGLTFESPLLGVWFGAPNGPAAFLAADAGVAEILDALDPFGRLE
jgi:hypothetical protein